MFFGTSTNELGGETEVEDSSGQTALFVCSKISSEMKNLQQELRGLTSAVRHLQSQQTESQQENGKKTGKKSLAKGLPAIVHDLYKGFTTTFESSELFESQQNQQVARLLQQQIHERHKENYNMREIKTAVHRYYETKRRKYNDSLPHRIRKVAENKRKAKRKGYQDRLYHRRDKVIRSDEDQIKRLWEQIGPQYMTEESSDEEGAMKLHHLQWESDELQELKCILDGRVREKEVCSGRFSAKPRVESSPSTTSIPYHPVQWAVKSTSSEEGQAENDPIEPSPIVSSRAGSQHSPIEPSPTVHSLRRVQHSTTEPSPIVSTGAGSQHSPIEPSPTVHSLRRVQHSTTEPSPIVSTGAGSQHSPIELSSPSVHSLRRTQHSTISPSLQNLLQQHSPQSSSSQGDSSFTPRRPRGGNVRGRRNHRIPSNNPDQLTESSGPVATLQQGQISSTQLLAAIGD